MKPLGVKPLGGLTGSQRCRAAPEMRPEDRAEAAGLEVVDCLFDVPRLGAESANKVSRGRRLPRIKVGCGRGGGTGGVRRGKGTQRTLREQNDPLKGCLMSAMMRGAGQRGGGTEGGRGGRGSCAWIQRSQRAIGARTAQTTGNGIVQSTAGSCARGESGTKAQGASKYVCVEAMIGRSYVMATTPAVGSVSHLRSKTARVGCLRPTARLLSKR